MRSHLVALVAALGFAGPAAASPWPVPLPPPVVVVHAPPPPPAYAYPTRPCADALWIDGRWAWAGRQRTWQPGYWQVPPRVVYAPAVRPVPVHVPVRPYPAPYAPGRPYPVRHGRWW